MRYLFCPNHFVSGLGHFVFGRKVDPNLKEVQTIGFVGVDKREHFGMHETGTGGHPLNITVAVTPACPTRVKVVNETVQHDGHRFKTPVRMGRKARYGSSMVHLPVVSLIKIRTDVAAHERFAWSHQLVAFRVQIKVMDAEQKGVKCRPDEAHGLI
jgi:hypothetical protein